MEPTKRLYADDLAKLLGKTERTARRMLETLEAKHGAAVVRRDGRERYSTQSDLERVNALDTTDREPRYDAAKLMASLRRLLSDVAALAVRVDALDERITDVSVQLVHMRA